MALHAPDLDTSLLLSAEQVEGIVRAFSLPCEIAQLYRKVLDQSNTARGRIGWSRKAEKKVADAMSTAGESSVEAAQLAFIDQSIHSHQALLTYEVYSSLEKEVVSYEEVNRVLREILWACLPEQYEQPDEIPGYETIVHCVAQCLADAEAEGHPTHGVQRIIDYIESLLEGLKPDRKLPYIDPFGEITTVSESDTHVQYRGGMNFGQAVATMAVSHGLKNIGDNAGYKVAARDSYHMGRLKHVMDMVVGDGHAGTAVLNIGGGGRVSGWPDGLDSVTGTNPIAMGVPSEDGGRVVDFASSFDTEGLNNVLRLNNLFTPGGMLWDYNGNPTSNPRVLYYLRRKGTIRPMAGHKGYALAQMIDLQVNQITGRVADEPMPKKSNALYVDITNVSRFTDAGTANALVENKERQLADSRTMSGNALRLPGVGGNTLRETAKTEGLHILKGTWRAVLQLHRDVTQSPQ